MKKSDVVVIGGGLAGLFAAAVAAKSGKKVTVLSYGAGSLTIGGGVVDIMGYADGNIPFDTPRQGVENAEATHPYAKIGIEAVEEAVAVFSQMAKEEGYEYLGSLDEMKWIPTAVGTLKPTALVPRSMDTSKMEAADKLVLVDLEGLKDFAAPMAAKNLALLFPNKTIETVKVSALGESGRDMTAYDVARCLDQSAVRRQFAAALNTKAGKGVCFIAPPVIGTHANYEALDEIEKLLGAPIVECAAVAPSVTGIRLREMMMNILRKQGVVFIEKATVCGAVVENGKAVAVLTKDFGRQRTYRADEFILASGGFYGGGLAAEQENVREVVFGLPVAAPERVEEWTNKKMFSDTKQPFAMIGLLANEALQPTDLEGNVLLENVRIVGRNLAGYDFCFEKSGNGVALTSAYKAIALIVKGGMTK